MKEGAIDELQRLLTLKRQLESFIDNDEREDSKICMSFWSSVCGERICVYIDDDSFRQEVIEIAKRKLKEIEKETSEL